MKRRKIRIGRIILAIGIYIIIGIIPIKLTSTNTNRAKSEYAKELLADSREYPIETREILIRASKEPNYAGKEIHVWDPDGRGYRSYSTYIGGGRLHWYENGYIVPGKGEELGEVILKERNRANFYSFFGTLWFIGVPLLIIFAFAYEDNDHDDNRRNYYSQS